MGQTAETGDMTKYQFQIDDRKWTDWKNTVPRSKSLETRIIELIEADADDRVLSTEERREYERLKEQHSNK